MTDHSDDHITRREFIGVMGAGTAAVWLGGCASTAADARQPAARTPGLADFGPIDRTLGDKAPSIFYGEEPSRAHEILWNKTGFMKSVGDEYRKHPQFADVVIVGGGMSGLISAYLTRDRSPIVLESASRFGGNSRGQSWRGVDYTLATAYFGVPDEGAPFGKFLEELGLGSAYRIRSSPEAILVGSRKYLDAWKKGTVPASREHFRKVDSHLAAVLAGTDDLAYPEIPFDDEKHRNIVVPLDRLNFREYLEKVVGGPLHPHVEGTVERYFWSTFAASMSEVSAASGLNFFAADHASAAVFPGGNAALAERVLERTMAVVPPGNLRPSSLVFDVRRNDRGAEVSYVDAQGAPKMIQAKAVIMACPKFVLGKVLEGIEPERSEIIGELKYRSYLVANILVNVPLKEEFYDLFFIDERSLALKDVKRAALQQKVTDVTSAAYAKTSPSHGVLTLYRGFPYDGARTNLLASDAFDRYRKEFETQIHAFVLPQMGLKPTNIVDIRMARWGHPLPVPEVGLIASGKVDWLRKPFRDVIFMAEQDNWMLPCLEVAHAEAARAAAHVRARLV